MGQTGTETKLGYWSLACQDNGPASLALALLLGLVGISAGLWSQKLCFCSKTELNHLVVNETWGMAHLGQWAGATSWVLGARLSSVSACGEPRGNLATTAHILLHVRTWKAFPVTAQEPISRLVWMSSGKRNLREKKHKLFLQNFLMQLSSFLFPPIYTGCTVLFCFLLVYLFECLSFSFLLTCSLYY